MSHSKKLPIYLEDIINYSKQPHCYFSSENYEIAFDLFSHID